MVAFDRFEKWRGWAPVPTRDQGVKPVRWILLEANRYAVTGALLTLTFVSILAVGSIWTFQMQRVLTETQAVQTLLNTLLSGIILLVSIVVSINSIVLSYDITDVGAQEDRIEDMLKFREELSLIADPDEDPTDPDAFLQVMARAIRERAQALLDVSEGSNDEFVTDIYDYVDSIARTAKNLEASLDRVSGAEFGVLWLGLETDYGPMINRSRQLTAGYGSDLPESSEEKMDDLIQAMEVFATGREYFKTLYYSREISELSRTLLVISLPSILITATTILAINAELLPDVWVLGLPPLLTFVAVTFTIALAPYIVLTSFMLRVATVARRTSAGGPFVLQS